MQPEPEIEETPAEPLAVLPPARSRRDLWLEVVAVCLIGVLPALGHSLGSLVVKTAEPSFNVHETYLVLRSVQVSWLVLYLMSRSQAPWSHFGIVRPRLLWDSLAACGIAITAHVCHNVYLGVVMEAISTEALQRDTHAMTALFPPPTSPEQTLLLIVAEAANGFAEEVVMRGYLIPRFEDLLGSPAKAVVLSSLLFGSYHLYQGFYGAGSALVIGLLFGVIFCSTRRLWPLAVAHALVNLSSRLG
jgi:membrane protease YdiL (CAAX protease family)